MKNPYLVFYEQKDRKVLISNFDKFDQSQYPYIKRSGDYYELLSNIFIGKLDLKANFAFLLQEEKDIYIDINHVGTSMHNDIVLVIKENYNDYYVEMILNRALEKIVAEVSFTKNNNLRLSSDMQVDREIKLSDHAKYLVSGHVVLLEVEKITNKTIFTKVTKVIGHIDQPDIEVLKIVELHGWPLEFNEDIYEELENITIDYDYEKTYRVDLTNEFTVTIDGKDAKDLDDAISISKTNDHYKVGVHIADVSYFVNEGGAIDTESYLRSTSLYLADRVVPMLPQKLSNDLCSLNPNTDKLTISCMMDIDFSGNVINYEIVPSVINTKHRLNYDDVNDLINDNKLYEDIKINETIFMFVELSNILEKVRRKRGALEFESKELKFIVDEKGRPLNVVSRKTGKAEELIESMMLIANETVARHVRLKKYPATYRVHEKPDHQKISEAVETLSKMGITHKDKNFITPKHLQILLDKAHDTPFVQIAHMVLLRSMKKAKYFEEPLGHFGLGASDYTHFTAPIRRYSDLYLHRILHRFEFDKTDYRTNYKHFSKIVSDVSYHTSLMEKEALVIEREVNQLKSCEYMLDKVGKKLNGVITSFMRSGMFIELENGIEGFVSLKSFNDYLNYDENKMAFIGRFNEYRLGQKVLIKVTNVNIAKRQIDFGIIDKGSKNYESYRNKQKS